jgi:hypothetical protein
MSCSPVSNRNTSSSGYRRFNPKDKGPLIINYGMKIVTFNVVMKNRTCTCGKSSCGSFRYTSRKVKTGVCRDIGNSSECSSYTGRYVVILKEYRAISSGVVGD